MDELRSKGLAKMNEVYGWEMPNIEGDPYFDLTVDHLFGTIWTRPGLSMRDKRIMTLTAVTALGQSDLAEIQVNAALHNGELTADELHEMAIFLTHYLGFPLGSKFDGAVGRVVAKRRKAAEKGEGEDKKANVNAAVKMHSGKTLDERGSADRRGVGDRAGEEHHDAAGHRANSEGPGRFPLSQADDGDDQTHQSDQGRHGDRQHHRGHGGIHTAGGRRAVVEERQGEQTHHRARAADEHREHQNDHRDRHIRGVARRWGGRRRSPVPGMAHTSRWYRARR